MDKIRWGILGAAKIAIEKVIPGMQKGAHIEIQAIASRELARAQSTAQALAIPKAYGSYEALLSDPDIDAVYIPLPNHLHVPWSLKAIECGKHVLCEKPIGLNASEAATLLRKAEEHPEIKVMEAFMYRFHPQWQHAKKLVDEGAIGQLRAIETIFSYHLVDPSNVRNIAEYGGGGLLDIGCYPISLSRYLFSKEPERVIGCMEFDPSFRTDRLATGILDFGGGTATFTISTQMVLFQRVHILGESGRIEIEVPFNPPPDHLTRIWLQTTGEAKVIEFEPVDQYMLQGEAFSLAILQSRPTPTPLQDAVANMRIIDNLAASAREGLWKS